jgi:hypothetical protein
MNSFLDKLSIVDVDTALKTICVASFTHNNQIHAFLSSTHERSVVLAKEFETLIESIPEWARTKITVKRSKEFEFENGVKVKFINSPIYIRGMTMNSLFIAADWQSEDIEYIVPCLARGAMISRIK